MFPGFDVAQICGWIGGRVANAPEAQAGSPGADGVRVTRLAPLAGSQAADLAFFFNPNYQHELPRAHPGVLVTGEAFVGPLKASGLPLWKSSVVVACPDPYLGMAILSEKFADQLSTVAHPAAEAVAEMAETGGKPQLHPTAVVDPTADLGAGVRVGAHAVVEAGARIGNGTVLYPGVFVGPGVTLGERCVLFPNVVVYEWCQVGNRVRIHANSVVGADGFGYAPRLEKDAAAPGGARPLGHQKIFHLGRVLIGDDVEIGASTTIDRGTLADTRVDAMAKLDNNVHLGHNSHVGEGAIICGATALAGNASVGKFAYVGGISGIVNHVHVGDGAKVGAMSLLTKDVAPGETVVGSPQRSHKDHFRVHAWLSRAAARKTKQDKKET